jgi:hypothetical protein
MSLRTMYENPSAGKFDPPPEPPSPSDVRARRRYGIASAVILAAPIVRWLYPHPAGWAAVLVIALMFSAGVLDLFRATFLRPPNDPGPYPDRPRLTR